MGFRLFIDVLVALVLSLYYWLESIVLFFLPKNKKDVRGDVVLITGAGSGLGKNMQSNLFMRLCVFTIFFGSFCSLFYFFFIGILIFRF